jgi:hypothetical protein
MKKFFSTIFWLGIFTGIGYCGFKLYNKIMSIVNISKTLPQYLDNVIGEQPKVDIRMTLTSGHLKVSFSQDTLDKNTNIKEMIQEYINDFYPVFADGKLSIEVIAKIEKAEKETPLEDTEPIVAEKPVEDSDFDISLGEEKE